MVCCVLQGDFKIHLQASVGSVLQTPWERINEIGSPLFRQRKESSYSGYFPPVERVVVVGQLSIQEPTMVRLNQYICWIKTTLGKGAWEILLITDLPVFVSNLEKNVGPKFKCFGKKKNIWANVEEDSYNIHSIY